MRLFVDISSHGLGHLAQMAPLLTALYARHPGLELLIRSGLSETRLRERIGAPFTYFPGASDFGFHMQDAVHVNLEASAAAYRAAHADWSAKVAEEAAFLLSVGADRVLSDVSYLPLAGAFCAGIPAVALCSLNWADLFQHFFGREPWAEAIYQEILAAYRSARAFLRVTPAMPMGALGNTVTLGPLASGGIRRPLDLPADCRGVLIAMGGIAMRLPVETWPRLPGVRWLVPAEWQCDHPDALTYTGFGNTFTDLLGSVDAILTKPGYGTFVEAAGLGVPVLYLRREDWPEQDDLISWLEQVGCCREISPAQGARGDLSAALEDLWSRPRPQPVALTGVEEAVAWLCRNLLG